MLLLCLCFSTHGGPSFYMLQSPDDAVPPPTEICVDGGLVAGRRRIEVRGVQVEKKAWGIVLRKKEGKYSYLEIHVQPDRNRIMRYVKNPLINNEEDYGIHATEHNSTLSTTTLDRDDADAADHDDADDAADHDGLGGCPITPGQRFVVEIRINEHDYELHINRQFFARYEQSTIRSSSS